MRDSRRTNIHSLEKDSRHWRLNRFSLFSSFSIVRRSKTERSPRHTIKRRNASHYRFFPFAIPCVFETTGIGGAHKGYIRVPSERPRNKNGIYRLPWIIHPRIIPRLKTRFTVFGIPRIAGTFRIGLFLVRSPLALLSPPSLRLTPMLRHLLRIIQPGVNSPHRGWISFSLFPRFFLWIRQRVPPHAG